MVVCPVITGAFRTNGIKENRKMQDRPHYILLSFLNNPTKHLLLRHFLFCYQFYPPDMGNQAMIVEHPDPVFMHKARGDARQQLGVRR